MELSEGGLETSPNKNEYYFLIREPNDWSIKVPAQLKHHPQKMSMGMSKCITKQYGQPVNGNTKGAGEERKKGKKEGRQRPKKREARKRGDGGCNWPVVSITRGMNPMRRRSAGFPGNRRTETPNSARKQQRENRLGDYYFAMITNPIINFFCRILN